MQVPGMAKTAPDGGSVLEWDVLEIFLVLVVYRNKEAGRDLVARAGLWMADGGKRKHLFVTGTLTLSLQI